MTSVGIQRYILGSVSVALICLFTMIVYAGADIKPVYKVCSNCHTLHASQDALFIREGGAPMVGQGGECSECHGQLRGMLLRLDCLGCHAKEVNGGSSIVYLGDIDRRIPQVAHAGTDLAAGNFSHVFGYGNDDKGHNVHGFGADISIADLMNLPPGYDPARDPSSLGYDQFSEVAQIMCAGANGCHGNRNEISHIEAMRGSHHTDDSILQFGPGFTETGQGATAGLSYRFLLGVRGGEDAEWEGSVSASAHNEYKGASAPGSGGQSYANAETISEFCGHCHGAFHEGSASGVGGTSSPWFRHPSDMPLPDSGEYTGYDAYNTTIPLARQALSGSSSSVITRGTDAVMCLSCHRAHASPFAKALRWDYKSDVLATALSGCAVCHSSMN